MTLPRRKTLAYIALSLALIAVAVFWVGTETSWAVTAPPTSAQSTINKGFQLGNKAAEWLTTLGVVYVILGLLFSIFSLGLTVVGSFLNFFFTLNTAVNPAQLDVVLIGWTILRDLANGLFILLVLWIAITIIFNLDSWGGKRLLVRVIIVALLINFSLLMVSVVFAFANEIAKPFPKALGLVSNPQTSQEKEAAKAGIAGFIVNNSRIQTIAQQIKDEGVLKAFDDAQKAAETSPPPQQIQQGSSFLRYVGAPVPEAKAAGPLTACVFGIFTGAFTAPSALCLGLAAAAAIAYSVGAWWVAVGITQATWQGILNIAIADGVLVVTIVAILTATILLLARIVAMVFLGVFAPVAFLALVTPRYGERIWNMWLSNLFRWAFVAPIFYFLLYLSLLMLNTGTNLLSPQAKEVPIHQNLLALLNLFVFLTFLWASIFLTRKAAGMGAEAALAFGKKLAGVGLGVGTGLAARWALPAAGRFATRMQEKINQSPLARATFGRGITRYGLRTVAGASRKQIADAETRINNMGLTPTEIQQGIASGRFKGVNLAAAANILRKGGNLDVQPGVQGYEPRHLREAATMLRDLNLEFVPLVRANPTFAQRADFNQREFNTHNPDGTLADSAINEALTAAGRSGQAPTADDMQAAVELLAWRRLRPSDVATMDLDILRGRANDHNKLRFLEMASGEHLSQLGRRDTRIAGEIQAYLEQPANRPLWDSFDDAKKRYFSSSTAVSIGIWRVPPGAAAGGASPFRVLVRNPTAAIAHGAAYTSAPLVAGGSGTYTATLVSGSLPTGLSIDNTGRITGTTGTTIPPGTSFTAQYDIDDGSGSPQRVTINITIT